ncbi:NADH-dependent [FeFe] hydrogenase, group A6 [Salinispira pacifica]|uniref:Periplasmic [Fe] hydrogenase large subunit n=1 Tax=Salinispira pacifica TaxID=1307761 RepID=V5WD22_9SPIO|nr:NADH-dependent [FeFe] hydrogenase, group A6 [Salinispira pacifica]AHC13718.1 Periplasmic [Fe] hydrogenase large subunit [Salinispira pacifica]
MVNVKINGIDVQVEEGTTILEAAKQNQIKVPTLCYHQDLEPWAACGICVVKTEGSPKMVRACATPVHEGANYLTHDAEIVEVRKSVVEMILSNHPDDCLYCPRNQNCELQRLAQEFGIREQPFEKNLRELPVDDSTPSIILDPEKCVLCGRCAKVCQDMQNVWALEFIGRGDETRIAGAGDIQLNETPCIKCGQCSAHCPVGAIYENSQCGNVWNELRQTDKHVVVQVAPAVRVAIGEAFGNAPGTIMTGQMYAALRKMGFDAIFDTNFAADLTIMEEATEFVSRFTKGETLPLITTCCPSWVDYLEKYYSEMIPHFSTAKSPQMMMASMIKSYYADQKGIKPEDITVVSIMPCTSKKYEITRDDHMFSSGIQDCDYVLTTREFSRMIKQAGIDFNSLPEEEADNPLGMYTGAGTIFGVSGGVMEAALRSAYNMVTGEDLTQVNFQAVRGIEGIKEAEIDIKGTKVRVAVAHQMGNIEEVLKRVKKAQAEGGEIPYHFIEVMACRGGCIAGGGQPYGATDEIRQQRIDGLYADDTKQKIRMSHQNPYIQKIYSDFLDKPGSEKAHKFLHTHYTPRPLYQK